jgi:hypothetical protein
MTALAQKSYPQLGTFPAGSSSNTIFIGGVMFGTHIFPTVQ